MVISEFVGEPPLERHENLSNFCGGGSPSVLPSSYSPTDGYRSNRSSSVRRRGRAFHRCLSGITLHQSHGSQCYFFDLTSDFMELADFQHANDVLFKSLRRRYPDFQYFKVREFQERGAVHGHYVINRRLSVSVVRALWLPLTRSSQHPDGCPIMYFSPVRGNHRRVAGYISKYCSKDHQGRYGFSRHWVYPGFVKEWKHLCSLYFDDFPKLCSLWNYHLSTHQSPSFQSKLSVGGG